MPPDPANLQHLPAWMQLVIEWLRHQQFLAALLMLMTLDVLTGLMLAIGRKQLSSSISFRGMAKKGTTLIILGTCASIEPFANGVPLLGPASLYFIVTEAISILEHAGAIGVPLPPFLMEALQKVREQKVLKNLPPGAVVVNPTVPIQIEAHVETKAAPEENTKH